MISHNKEKGFTLIEISVVLVIIGLLVGGILKGQELITNTKIKNLSQDMLDIQAAYHAYKDRTGEYPAPNSANLNQFQYYDTLFWENLRKEGFIGSSDYISSYGLIGPKYTHNGQFIFFGNMSMIIQNDHSQYLCVYPVPVQYAHGLDLKLDDGFPSSGRIKSLQTFTFAMKNSYGDYPSQETELFLCMSFS